MRIKMSLVLELLDEYFKETPKSSSLLVHLRYISGDTIELTHDDLREVVALTKANQHPSIDAMRFEAAKAAMQGLISYQGINRGFDKENVQRCASIADALIAEL